MILGEEVSSADGEIVALFIDATIPRDLSAEATADAIHAQGGLVSVPHPFDPFRKSHIRPEPLERLAASGRIDMIEVFNSRVTLGRHNELSAEFATRHGIPAIACSDSHTAMEVAMSFNALPVFDSAAGLRSSLARNEWHGSRTTKLVHLGTRWAGRRQLGGAPGRPGPMTDEAAARPFGLRAERVPGRAGIGGHPRERGLAGPALPQRADHRFARLRGPPACFSSSRSSWTSTSGRRSTSSGERIPRCCSPHWSSTT